MKDRQRRMCERVRDRERERERVREREREEYTIFQSHIIIVTLNHFILIADGSHHKLNKSDLIS